MPVPSDEEVIRSILVRTFPEANALSDETLENIIHQRPILHPGDEDDQNVVHMDFTQVLDILKDAVPIIAGALAIVKTHLEIRKLKKDNAPARTLPSAADIEAELLKGRPSAGRGLAGSFIQKITRNVLDAYKHSGQIDGE
jgi:hypothetical protein